MVLPATLTTSTISTPELDEYLAEYTNLVQFTVDFHNMHYAFVNFPNTNTSRDLKRTCRKIKSVVTVLSNKINTVQQEKKKNLKLAKQNAVIEKKLNLSKTGRRKIIKGTEHELKRRPIKNND